MIFSRAGPIFFRGTQYTILEEFYARRASFWPAFDLIHLLYLRLACFTCVWAIMGQFVPFSEKFPRGVSQKPTIFGKFYARRTSFRPAFDLRLAFFTCVWPAFDLRSTCVWPAFDLRLTCVWPALPAFGLLYMRLACCTCVWAIFGPFS